MFYQVIFIIRYEHLEQCQSYSFNFISYYFLFSFRVGVRFWSYGACSFSFVEDCFPVFVVVSAVVDSAFFLSCMFSAFVAAVLLAVMVFLVGFAAVFAFCFRIVNLYFHVLPRVCFGISCPLFLVSLGVVHWLV